MRKNGISPVYDRAIQRDQSPVSIHFGENRNAVPSIII
jgi:hypothetical protein